jgi:hypothetical protein
MGASDLRCCRTAELILALCRARRYRHSPQPHRQSVLPGSMTLRAAGGRARGRGRAGASGPRPALDDRLGLSSGFTLATDIRCALSDWDYLTRSLQDARSRSTNPVDIKPVALTRKMCFSPVRTSGQKTVRCWHTSWRPAHSTTSVRSPITQPCMPFSTAILRAAWKMLMPWNFPGRLRSAFALTAGGDRCVGWRSDKISACVMLSHGMRVVHR